MASTYTAITLHIVFATKDRAPMIEADWRNELHRYIGGTVNGLGAQSLAVGGVADHVHLLAGLKGVHSSSELVREVKKASTTWARERLACFQWQAGYAAFSVSPSNVPEVTAYIQTQEAHHRQQTAIEELLELLGSSGIEPDPKYFE